MVMKKLYLFLALLLPFLMITCSNDQVDMEGNSGDSAEVIDEDDGKPHPDGSFDYSKIAPHPRLMLSKDQETILKENLEKNPDMRIVHNEIIKVCDNYLRVEPVKYELEGKRLLNVSREALMRILYLSYAYRTTGDNRYCLRAEREVNAVCDFKDWDPNHFLDAAEMAMAVAIAYDWLYAELKPETRENIRESLIEKAFKPSGDNYDFENDDSNWNSVCNGALAVAALAIYESAKDISVDMIERAFTTNKNALEVYGPDGNYPEGYTYWDYGTTYEIMMLSSLESALGSDKGLHTIPGFMDTAEYMLFMSGTTGLCFNYSDCDETEIPLVAMFWFAKKSNNTSLLYREKEKMKNGGNYANAAGSNRFLPLALVWGYDVDMNGIAAPEKKIWVGGGLTPVALIHTGWGTDDDTYLGIKGGRANESHAHMDAGSFVYDRHGVRWAKDFGIENYTELETNGIGIWDYSQNGGRWDILRYGVTGHNTIMIYDENDNTEERLKLRHNVNGFIEMDKVFDDDSFRGVEMDMTLLYRGNVQKAIRKIGLENGDLSVTDNITTGSKDVRVRWNMLTSADAVLEADGKTITLTKDGKTIHLNITSPVDITLKEWSTEPPTSFEGKNPGTRFVGFECTLPQNNSYELVVDFR